MFSNNNNNSVDESRTVPTSTASGTATSASLTSVTASAVAKPSAGASVAGGQESLARGLGGSMGALDPAASSTLPLAGHLPLGLSQSGSKLNQEAENIVPGHEMHAELFSLMGLNQLQLPEMETFEVELVKDQQGLGITIAGYVCEKGKNGEWRQVTVCLLDSRAD